MKEIPTIVVLDGYTLNHGDLSWEGLEALGTCTVYDRTPPEDVLDRASGTGIVLTNKTVLDRNVIDSLPDMQYIGVMATGYNVVDLEAAAGRGIPVTNVPEYASKSVVQMVFALLLELTQNVALHSAAVHSGKWSKSRDFCFWERPLVELDGLTMGIIGYGRIGREVASVARAFGMRVLVYEVAPAAADDSGVEFVSRDDIFQKSDVVSLHCPLTEESGEIVNTKTLALMKETAYLINTGRGPLVNDRDLADALDAGRIAGAGLDVLTTEPPEPDNPLLCAKNCFITPHIAWASRAARSRLMNTVAENVRAFIEGGPVNVVNGV